MGNSLADIFNKETNETAAIEQQQRQQQVQETKNEEINRLMQVVKEANAQIDRDAGDEAGKESSDLDSSEASDDDDDDDDKLLRMIEEAEDDDEMGMDIAADTGDNGPSTRNEVVDPLVSKPSMDVVPETATLSELGVIQSIVGSAVIIRAHQSAERQVVDSESIVALSDRRVLGLVFDVFGPITRPMYTVRFPAPEDIDASVCVVGTPVFYSPELAQMVDTSAIRVKGTDASNEYDEEVGSDAMEFSDDEAERMHRRQKKSKGKGTQKAPPQHKPDSNATQQPPPPSVSGRTVQSYQDLYDPDLGF
ncbi:hypothetical protein IW140_001378 [Coemansia sp. RSA 1813]|nr:hypothetical protein EV178_001024 [Coemansia sp. RSA 1646]KAJ1772235.1 hypothetical protein LPJ74_001665 [Coemansia sp. RSA 1843]KAJ2091867.1 hypothetical protein IW138_001556 [Coemansia sp. RSA 986]KAJ2215806.1 hypothetical protein EV179_001826 [Coemansia sp. RSA 487]KAJ2571737.1 hypothetical protein IW140_001378 [Coemansia sp. RSA 1813]